MNANVQAIDDQEQKRKREDKHDGKVYEGNIHGGHGGRNAADTGL